MTLVTPSQASPGEEITAAKVNTPVNQLAAVVNALDDTNIVSISGAKIADGTIATAKYADASVTNAKLSTSVGEVGAVWQSWTPTYTGISGGTTTYAKWTKVGKTVYWRWRYTLSGANVSGATTVTLPTAMASDYQNPQQIGGGFGAATSAAAYRQMVATLDTSNSRMNIWSAAVSGSTITTAALSSTSPATWASTGFIEMQGFYEAA